MEQLGEMVEYSRSEREIMKRVMYRYDALKRYTIQCYREEHQVYLYIILIQFLKSIMLLAILYDKNK